MDAEDGLEVTIDQMLKAFELAKDHTASARSHKQFLHNRWDVALSILDRALMECDRGLKLLDKTTKPDDPPTNIVIWPYGLG